MSKSLPQQTDVMWKVLAYLTVLVFSVSMTNDYCKMCSDHTMCMYKGVSERCGKFIKQGLDKSEKKSILDIHNMLRNKVALGEEKRGKPGPQPTASNMMRM
ncbi:unnamed protein product, partial [Timema podura]|nr:unnamed protein product [Timema podura]